MTTYCHIGMGRLGIAVANAMMLLQENNTHLFYEPVASLRLTILLPIKNNGYMLIRHMAGQYAAGWKRHCLR